MNERENWAHLRDKRMSSHEAEAAYEQARAAYELGRMVRELREARGLSQRELAERMGTTQSVVGRLEAGGSRPTIVTLDRVAHALGLQLEVRFHDVHRSPGEPHAKRSRGKVARAAAGP
jgi:ribosome-binding protein aMBF1 (putative translation factor)